MNLFISYFKIVIKVAFYNKYAAWYMLKLFFNLKERRRTNFTYYIDKPFQEIFTWDFSPQGFWYWFDLHSRMTSDE